MNLRAHDRVYPVCGLGTEYLIVNRPLWDLRPSGARLTLGDRLRVQADALSLKAHTLFAIVFLCDSANDADRRQAVAAAQ